MGVPGTLITRNYSNFRGVDFSNEEVSLYRSPLALNMWKNYASELGKCIETRPDIELYDSTAYDGTICGLFFYKVGNTVKQIVHSGTKLYDGHNVIFTGMNPVRSTMLVINNILYILDGINYLSYDGQTCGAVEGAVPTTSISRSPAGGGVMYQSVNLLSDYRKNSFCADGTSTVYVLDATNIDTNYTPYVTINEVRTTEFTVNYTEGKITFTSAPPVPDTDGQDNVIIKFKKTVSGYRNRINNCRLMAYFDNHLFFAGNPDYPNTIYHSAESAPDYVSDLKYYNDGTDNSIIKALVPGNNALWVFKEPSQANTTIFYHIPTYDATEGMIYPRSHSSITTGCATTGINFNDDIVFFSNRGLEGISSDITTEQVIAHRSGFVDNKLLREEHYENMILEEYEGYLMVFIDNKVYLADSRQQSNVENHMEYEWFYWEFDGMKPTCTCVHNDVLYICMDDKKIYTLSDFSDNRSVTAYWSTLNDEFKYPQYQKTTNKRGCVIDVEASDGLGGGILVAAALDNNELDLNNYDLVGSYDEAKGYVVCRIKRKKWKSISLMVAGLMPFKLFSFTLEAYVGGYVKR